MAGMTDEIAVLVGLIVVLIWFFSPWGRAVIKAVIGFTVFIAVLIVFSPALANGVTL